jgi:hypothetical protein
VLFELLAVDENALKFCNPLPSGTRECKVYFGLEEDGSQPTGAVIRFQTKTELQGADLREVPVGAVTWNLCHNLAFNVVPTFLVDAKDNSSTGGTPVDTGIDLVAGRPLIVSVDPKSPNIWNSGVLDGGANNCAPFGCRWSTADGQVRDLVARADDGPTPSQSSATISGEPVGTLIGENLFAQDGGNTQGNLKAAIGTLVGRIRDSDPETADLYFVLGTDFNGLAPATGRLELFYWDVNNADNEGSVTVQVLTEQPISCEVVVNGKTVSTQTVSNIRAFQPVEVKGFPIFDLSNVSAKLKLPYPLAAVACTAGDNEIQFARNGAPIKPDTVLVNNMEVDVKAFAVLNTVHTRLEPTSACDPTKQVADLNLLLDYTDLKAAILSSFPGGQCKNGSFTFNVTFHDRATPPGFYAGEATVKLTNCPNPK